MYKVFFLFLFHFLNAQDMPHPVVQSFFSNGPLDSNSYLDLQITIAPNWHITSNAPEDEFAFPVKIETSALGIEFDKAQYPQPTLKYIEVLKLNASYFEKTIMVRIPIKSVSTSYDSLSLKGLLHYQSCTNEICLAPEKMAFTLNPLDLKKKALSPNFVKSEPLKTEGIWLILLFAFIGGLLLNLMPCVLPVLALKVYSLVRQAEADRQRRAALGISFSLGILTSLWTLGLLVYALRKAGESVGWGFQFQNVEFNLFMIALLSLFAFNLFGLFEINLPSSTSTSAVKLSNKDGMVGAFISGGFMTLLATPCSAPFLGPALGYAFSKDTLSLFLILTLVGIGLALPYLLLTLVPNLQRFLPKPGDWMVHFKHFTGFVLLGTALFLIWVLGSFGGEEFVVYILLWVLITGLWSWIFGIFAPIPTPIWRRVFMWILLIMVSLYWFNSVLKPTYLIPQSDSQTETGWKAFDANEIAKISQGKVFIDFTAKWCISCRANKNLVLETSEVENAFKNGQVHLYRADWTQKSKHITKALASYGRSAVPTYVFITDGKVEVLPELLTKSMLVQRSQ